MARPLMAGDDLAAAKKHFAEAQAHYRLGRFDDAMRAYTLAYEKKTLPEFLFNIGQCHRQLGNHERAVFFFEGYLRDKPDAANRELVETLIAESVAALEIEHQAAASAAATRPPSAPLPAPVEATTPAAKPKATIDTPVAATPPPAPASPPKATNVVDNKAKDPVAGGVVPEVDDGGLLQKWWFWTAIGGATAVIATTVGIALSAPQDDKAPAPPGDTTLPDLALE